MSEATELGLELDERCRVWAAIRDLALDDETLSRVVRTFQVWDGKTSISRADATGSMCPLLKMTPIIGAQSWYSPDSQAGFLTIRVELAVITPYILDPMSLWGTLERVYYPRDFAGRESVRRALVDAGAETGQLEFSAPANDPDPKISDDGLMIARGSMRLMVVRSLDP